MKVLKIFESLHRIELLYDRLNHDADNVTTDEIMDTIFSAKQALEGLLANKEL